VTTTTASTAAVVASTEAPTSSTSTSAATTTTTTVAPAGIVVEERTWSRGSRALATRVYRPRASGHFPVFVWVHGFRATVDFFDPLLRYIAGHGYVVVAPRFPLTRADAPGPRVYNDYVNQPADVSFVVSKVLAEFAPDVDSARVSVGGHSLGAVTTMALVSNRCCFDARVRAAVEVDGSNLSFPSGAVEERGIPLLLIHGDADRTFSINESRTTYARATPPKYFVVLPGIGHVPFGIARADAVLEPAIVDFLDATLKHDTAARIRLVRLAAEAQP